MSGGWNARPTAQRERAERMWRNGRSAKEICQKLHLPRNTLTHWRWEANWPARKDYKDRPITNAKTREDLTPMFRRCPVCAGREDVADPHQHAA